MSERPYVGAPTLKKAVIERGSFDPVNVTPQLQNGGDHGHGDSYRVSTQGYYNFVTGAASNAADPDAEVVRTGDEVRYTGQKWTVIPIPVTGPFAHYVDGTNLPAGISVPQEVADAWVNSWYNASVPEIDRRTGDLIYTWEGVWQVTYSGPRQISEFIHPSATAPAVIPTEATAVVAIDHTYSSHFVDLDASGSNASVGETITNYYWRILRGGQQLFAVNTAELVYTAPTYANDVWGDIDFELTVTDSAGNTDTKTLRVNNVHICEVTIPCDGVGTPAPNHTYWTNTNTFGEALSDWGAGYTSDPAPGPVASFKHKFVTWSMKYFSMQNSGLANGFWDVIFSANSALGRMQRFYLSDNPNLGNIDGREGNLGILNVNQFFIADNCGFTEIPDIATYQPAVTLVHVARNTNLVLNTSRLPLGLGYLDYYISTADGQADLGNFVFTGFDSLADLDFHGWDNLSSLDLSDAGSTLRAVRYVNNRALGATAQSELILPASCPVMTVLRVGNTGIPTDWNNEVDFTRFPILTEFSAAGLNWSGFDSNRPHRLLNVPNTVQTIDLSFNSYSVAETDQIIADLASVVPTNPVTLKLTNNSAPTQNANYDAVVAAWGVAFTHD